MNGWFIRLNVNAGKRRKKAQPRRCHLEAGELSARILQARLPGQMNRRWLGDDQHI